MNQCIKLSLYFVSSHSLYSKDLSVRKIFNTSNSVSFRSRAEFPPSMFAKGNIS